MSSCLGLYIQNNLIKYAKVTKEKDNLKVESFGIKFFDNLNETINQIVAETFSYKIPISVNLSDEDYYYFDVFSLLNKNDLKKAIETEFDSFCYEKGYNKSALETRYALASNVLDKEKIKVIHISSNKVDINRKIQEFENYSISNISPLPMVIPNIADLKEKENVIIVNLEDKTTLTTIIDQKVYHVDKLEEGMASILSSINSKENSYTKAYEICKNTTIYTMEGRELLQEENNIYLDDIMPTLYNIVQDVTKIVENSVQKIDKLYITGTGSIINNIDLYFQEYLPKVKCEILKPYFIPETVKINMKDYVEVNSAIALALQGLEYGIKNINFKKPALADRLPSWMKIEIGKPKAENEKVSKLKNKFNFSKKINFSFSLKGALDNTEKWLLRTAGGVLIFFIIYASITTFLTSQTNNKLKQVEETNADTTSQIALVENDIKSLNDKETNYEEVLKNLEDKKSENSENKKIKDSIPNFLTSLMFGMPQEVTITSIKNTSGYTIRIEAEAKEYAQLGYLIGNIKTTGMLYNVTSTSGVKQNDVIKVTIEGSLFSE
jgi:hypothetical protein